MCVCVLGGGVFNGGSSGSAAMGGLCLCLGGLLLGCRIISLDPPSPIGLGSHGSETKHLEQRINSVV